MASFLNPYHNFINVLTKGGQTLFPMLPTNLKDPWMVTTKSVFDQEEKTTKTSWTTMCLSQRFGYQYLINDVSTVATITPAISPVIVDPTAGILAALAVPASTAFSDLIKIMDVYSDKFLGITQKHASLMWGDSFFMNQTPRVISELTQADGHLNAAG